MFFNILSVYTHLSIEKKFGFFYSDWIVISGNQFYAQISWLDGSEIVDSAKIDKLLF